MRYPLEDHKPGEAAKVDRFWPLSPNCGYGKHAACRGDAFDHLNERVTDCGCACHEEAA